MHILFVHQNYPAQFRYLAPRLAADFGWTCTFATARRDVADLPGVSRVIYSPRGGASAASQVITRNFENAAGHAHGVYEALKKRPDVKPDLVVAHSGFGSSLFLPYLYDASVINFFEYFYRPVGQDLGYRPEQAVTEERLLGSRTRNGMLLLDLDNCDRGWCPSEYQRGLMPSPYREKIEVIPEGVDTALWRPECEHAAHPHPLPCVQGRGGKGRRLPDGTEIPEGTRVVTYVSRGFELMRGFDVFMRAAKRIYEEFSDVLFVVVGTDKAYYGGDAEYTRGKSLAQFVLGKGEYDLSKFRFTGWLSEEELAAVLRLSDLHVYLTEPFVTSWSMLDAMACGCVVLASAQACVREYVTHGRNGLLCDFFDVDGIAKQAVEVLRDPAEFRVLGAAARITIEEEYSLDVCLPRVKTFFEEVAGKRRAVSLRAEGLLRAGTAVVTAARREPRPPGEAAARREPRPPGVRPSPFCSPVVHAKPSGKVILFAWELGGGLGHMMQMVPLAREMVRRGTGCSWRCATSGWRRACSPRPTCATSRRRTARSGRRTGGRFR